MTYLQVRKKPFAGIKAAAILTIIFVTLVTFIQVIWPGFFVAFFTSIAAPFWRTEFAVQSGSLRTNEYLLNENEYLKRELQSSEIRLQTVALVEQENAELKALLGRASTTPKVLAAVLKRAPAVAFDELIVDAGLDVGFKEGNLVYAPGNVLIGKISQVSSNTSKVRLFSSPGEKFEVSIGPRHLPATAAGRGGGQYESEFPRDTEIVEGDLVTVPSMKNELFGLVRAVVADPTQPFKKVFFAIPVNLYEMRWVLVSSNK